MRNFLSMNVNLKITVERSKRRTSYLLSLVLEQLQSTAQHLTIRPSKKTKHMFLVRISIKKRERAGGFFFCYLLFPIACFLYTLLPSPRDTLELLGQILIKRNIRY